MPGKVLIVDDIATNRIVLHVKLSAAGYTVLQAKTAAEALQVARAEQPHLMLCPTRLPDMTAEELIAAFEADPLLTKISRIILCDTNNAKERLDLLAAGATDVLVKPPDISVLLARFRAILRNSESLEDMRLQEQMEHVLGFGEAQNRFENAMRGASTARVVVVSNTLETACSWSRQLGIMRAGKLCSALTCLTFDDALTALGHSTKPDVIVIDIPQGGADKALSLLSDLHAGSLTRHAKIIAVLAQAESTMFGEVLDRGADDVLSHGFCAQEAALKVGRQAQAKQRDDIHRENMHAGLRAATTDALTGLQNRRSAMPHLARVAGNCSKGASSCAVMVIDVDHFKSVNDRFGHKAGDAALISLAELFENSLRADDMASRIGGEEFMIVLPETSVHEAHHAARRLCDIVANHSFRLPGVTEPQKLTVSIGVAVTEPHAMLTARQNQREPRLGDQIAEGLLREADLALYGSKNHGRNQVTLSPKSAA